MVKFFRWLLGYVSFCFSGGFCDGFINQCFEEKINIQNLKIKNEELSGECLAREYIKLHGIARKNGGKTRVIKKHGFIFPLLKLKNRWGLFVGGILFICIISFLSGFIWNIEIIGNSKISESEIVEFLDKNNLRRGVPWRSVEKDKIENLMLASFDDCAWVQINELKTTARIEINETIKKPQITPKKTANLKAKKDGHIVKASVTNGWQVARVGDSVTKGDLLISGIYESEKKKGNQFAHASGEYIAEVKESFSLTVSRKQSYKSYKEERIFKRLCFFGIEIPLYFLPYEAKNTELEAECSYLKLGGNELPIGIITIKERRYTVKSRLLSDSELQKLAENETKKKLEEEFSDCEIKKKNLKTAINADEAKISGELICLEDIGETVEIKIRKE